MREGRLGGAFWTVWAPCPDTQGEETGADFNVPTSSLRDSLEMLDLIQNMIQRHPQHMQYAHSSADIKGAFSAGKIASLLGMEGTHLLGNSLGVLRMFAQLGVRYLTLTHSCQSSFASSAGYGHPGLVPVHADNGLTDLGRELIKELNRLGIMVDLSHTTAETMKQVLAITKAPVVWTHAGARQLCDHPRNVPDEVLRMIGDGPEKNHGVIQSVFYPHFISTGPSANMSGVADHIEYIASIAGKKHVGIASDFDGMYTSVEGQEDASKYPHLVAELLSRGWTEDEMRDVMGGNLMRVMDEVDALKERLKDELPSSAVWEKRTDLPATGWGMVGNISFFPIEVKKVIDNAYPRHDEL
ncbi:hypothetical protein PV05_07961 [Exophiala xenobiotica]|uniref:Dipeptidase n=1 Tax=Exophiala xenobiotica TaxID=348802 RepID=A0A0D2EC82_9EURO|nr:uncharacterized protein PV05_07961 [Exophiala xenobiotica]KIW52315.1 hypothetical protein PV05_07961 [Exophiala xenobiotica]